MTKVLDYIVAKFPEYSSKIKDFYRNEEDFRILCEDFQTSALSLEKYRVDAIKTMEFETAYMEIYLALEKELLHILNSQTPPTK